MLLIMEAYTEYVLTGNNDNTKDIDKEINLEYFRSKDTVFYKILAKCFIRKIQLLNKETISKHLLSEIFCFISAIFSLTIIQKKLQKKNDDCSLIKMWKAMTLGSFGIFLLLPSLIWKGNSFHEFHITFVYLYTTLSQLLAYTSNVLKYFSYCCYNSLFLVVCRCSKLWSILVIITAYFCKISCEQVISKLLQ